MARISSTDGPIRYTGLGIFDAPPNLQTVDGADLEALGPELVRATVFTRFFGGGREVSLTFNGNLTFAMQLLSVAFSTVDDVTVDAPLGGAAFTDFETDLLGLVSAGVDEATFFATLLQGDDRSDGTARSDQIFGFGGNDMLSGGKGGDTLGGGEGDDVLNGGGGRDVLQGNDGDDVINGGPGSDTIMGGNGENVLKGGPGSNRIIGGDDVDVIEASGNDTVRGGDGDDRITLLGDSATKRAVGEDGDDSIAGSEGPDLITGSRGEDTLLGAGGRDSLFGGRGDDSVRGGAGQDLLKGENGQDTLWGNAGRDTIEGGAGSDFIFGGSGKDVLSGGSAVDVFIFDAGDSGTTRQTADRLLDFQNGTDLVNLFGVAGADAEIVTSFTGEANQIRISRGNINVDTDGDGGSDFRIRVFGDGVAEEDIQLIDPASFL